MSVILGFDPSKSTGWAMYDTDRHFSAIKCGTFEMPEKSDEYYTADQIGLKTCNLIRSCKDQFGKNPSFAVIEQQMAAQAVGTSFAGSIYPWIAVSSITATLANFGIPYGTLSPATWRRAFFGQGYKPPFKTHKFKKPDARGKTERIEWLWKDAAIKECERLGIVLPSTKALADDAAEAVALAICWKHKEINLHAGRYRKPWMDLVTGNAGKGERQVA